MTSLSNLSGQQALEFTLEQLGQEHQPTVVAPGLASATPADVASLQPGGNGLGSSTSAPVGQASRRVMSPPSVEEIAERVYRLFCQELRRERERRGHWR
jgi:hypothetical protein